MEKKRRSKNPRKGKRIVLVTQKRGATRGEFQAFARAHGASELMIPSDVIVIEKIPVLGSGKVDHLEVQKFVREQASARAAVVA